MRTGVAQRYRYVLYTHHQANLTVVSCSTVRLSHSLANPRGSLNTRAVFMGGGVWVETAAEIMTKKFCMCPSVSVSTYQFSGCSMQMCLCKLLTVN